MPPASRLRRAFLVAGPFLLVAGVRLATMGDALTNDEAGSAVVGRSWLRGDFPGVDPSAYGAYWFDRPPLLPLVYGLADLAGGATGVRLLGLAAALALVALVGRIARTVLGQQAVLASRWIAAPLLASAPMQADRTYGELLAAVPAALAVWLLALVCARVRGRVVLESFAAGAAAVAALLVKQSALDAALVAAALAFAGHLPRRAVVAGAAGMAATLALVAAWAATTPGGIGGLVEVTIGFRLEQLGANAASDAAPVVGVARLLLPAVLSGLLVAALAASIGIARLAGGWRRVLLASWCVAAVLGMLGGGFYWPHYLIQLVPPIALGGAALMTTPRSGRMPALTLAALLAALAIAGPQLRQLVPHTGRFDDLARRVGEQVRERSEPGDRILVLQARPGIVHASGLRSATPWLWSAIVQTRPGVAEEVERTLGSSAPPRWVVRWDTRPTTDKRRDVRVLALLHRRYDRVEDVEDRTIWRLRADVRQR